MLPTDSTLNVTAAWNNRLVESRDPVSLFILVNLVSHSMDCASDINTLLDEIFAVLWNLGVVNPIVRSDSNEQT